MSKSARWLTIGLALLLLTISIVSAQDAQILVNRDGVNVRLFPAIGAEVLGFVQAGWRAPATARSPDNEWIRVDFNGEEGWIGFPTINLFGDINSLPVADPRTIPFGGFESPRSGQTSASSPISGRLADSGLRVRAGPSRAYPVLANAPRYTVFPLLGRTANNAWLQVNFEGTLGWVITPFVEIQDARSIIELPINGIVADQLPLAEGTQEDFVATLRFLLSRIDLAQPSLDAIRGIWTTIALGDFVTCGPFPARPTNYNIPNPLLAAFFPTLDPLENLFNDAMTNTRLSIDLWLEVCGRPRPQRSAVGQATVTGALEAVNLADQQFAELRRRINDLLPPELELGPDECLFTFSGASEILKIAPIGQIVRGTFSPSDLIRGFCFDAAAGQSLRFEFLQVSGNATPRISISLFDNPTQFIANGLAVPGEDYLSVGPAIINTDGRYLLLITHDDEFLADPVSSDFALLISDVTGAIIAGPTLIIDPNTGEPSRLDPTVISTPGPIIPTQQFVGGCPYVTGSQVTCTEMVASYSCSVVDACFAAGIGNLDGDGNGIPCEAQCSN